MDFWDTGTPISGLDDGTNTTDVMRFFDTGSVYAYLFITSTPPAGNARCYAFIIG